MVKTMFSRLTVRPTSIFMVLIAIVLAATTVVKSPDVVCEIANPFVLTRPQSAV